MNQMRNKINIHTIVNIAKRDRIAFKRHALFRMAQRKITADDVKSTLLNGEIIEEYIRDWPLPSCLVLGEGKTQTKYHVVIAIDVADEMVWIITAYRPTLDEWEENFKVRRAQ